VTEVVPLPLTGSSITMRALAAREAELRRDVTRPVLLVGARGLGKHFLARGIHSGSTLGGRPLLILDARHGSDAEADRLLQDAPDGASLLVRHVEQLSPAAQDALDRRTGAQGRVARLLATSTADIVARVNAGEFRESLYYRLHAWPMHLPTLAERERDDVVALARAILVQTADGDDELPTTFDESAVALIAAQPWPENLRELEASLALAQLRARGQPEIAAGHLAVTSGETDVPPSAATLADVERWHLLRALARCRGNRTHAARQLGISRMTLITRLKLVGAPAQDAL
jgi:DNA-binding NtrC family response regulator